MIHSHDEAAKRRLWDHILVQAYGTSDVSLQKRMLRDPEGHAFFLSIDAAFTDSSLMSGCVPVDRDLVQYLAGWCRDTSKGYDERGGPFDKPGQPHNHFVRRAYDGFVDTLCRAIKHGHLRYYMEDRIMFGCFIVPKWFVDLCMNELQEQAEHENKMMDKFGLSSSHLQEPRFQWYDM